MLRVASVSLLGGIVLLLAFLQWRMLPTPEASAKVLSWEGPSSGVATVTGLGVVGAVSVPLPPFPAQDYRFLQLEFHASPDLHLELDWQSDSTTRVQTYPLESTVYQSLWLDTAELRGWTGEITGLTLVYGGKPGSDVTLHRVALHPPSLAHRLRNLYADWTQLLPWRHESINLYTGVTNASAFYPVPLTVGLLLGGLASYGALLLLGRKRLRFDWRVIGLLFLSSWLLLDLAWQQRLLRQVADTARTFAGKPVNERLAAGPNNALYQFSSDVKAALAQDARVFVTSANEYAGLRTAYYLYPLNVYWAWDSVAGGLPSNDEFRAGDYIAVISPSPNRYAAELGQLTTRGPTGISVKPILQHDFAKLYQVQP